MYTTNEQKIKSKRKSKTVEAHGILLRLDSRDFHGNITFNFKKGEGIKSYKQEEYGTIGE